MGSAGRRAESEINAQFNSVSSGMSYGDQEKPQENEKKKSDALPSVLKGLNRNLFEPIKEREHSSDSSASSYNDSSDEISDIAAISMKRSQTEESKSGFKNQNTTYTIDGQVYFNKFKIE
jgi:hypothetical protein